MRLILNTNRVTLHRFTFLAIVDLYLTAWQVLLKKSVGGNILEANLLRGLLFLIQTSYHSPATVPSKCPAFSCQLRYWFLHMHTPPFVVPLGPVRFQLAAASSCISSQLARLRKPALVCQDKTGLPCSTCQSCPWRHPVSVAHLQWRTNLHSFQVNHLSCPQVSDRLDGAPLYPLVRTVAGTVQGKEENVLTRFCCPISQLFQSSRRTCHTTTICFLLKF